MRHLRPRWPVAAALGTFASLGDGCRAAGGEEGSSAAAAAQPPLDEIVVTADFRDAKVADLPASVSVIDAAQLRATTVEHFEEAIREVPNLNLSGEGSRARYFQLRGVGELEQYDGAPNPSLGFIVDDIDFSGLGSIGTLYDVDRVEVLRGPQGTRYGANALGGLIYIRSRRSHARAFGRLQGRWRQRRSARARGRSRRPARRQSGLSRLVARFPRGRLPPQRVPGSQRHVRPRRARVPRQGGLEAERPRVRRLRGPLCRRRQRLRRVGDRQRLQHVFATNLARTRSARPRARSACKPSSTRSTS